MNNSAKSHTSSLPDNNEGVRITEHGSRGSRAALFHKLLALVLVACFATYVLMTVMEKNRSSGTNASSGQLPSDQFISDDANVSADEKAASSMTIKPENQMASAQSKQAARYDRNDLANYVAAGQAPGMEEVIDRLHAAGIHEGLGAFSPPGTSPPMIGLAVPDDYDLPEGYVRHFQATDDGQRIEPILMYSPDFNFYDSSGRQIAIPADRVVPANMAPPGLAIRPIRIPDPLQPTGP